MKKISVLLIAFCLLFSMMPVDAASRSKVRPVSKPVVTTTPTTTTPTTTTPTTTTPTTTTPTTTTPTTTTPTTTTPTTTTPTTTTPTTTTPQQLNVKDVGAKGDGVTDDTSAIQNALNQNDSVFIPDGTYMINVDQSLKPKSNQTITLSENAVLKAIPTTTVYNSVVWFDRYVSNISFSGGKIVGERYGHKGTEGEWGMGIAILDGSNNIKISNVVISDCWGDGVFLSGSPAVSEITIENVVGDNNRRQGMSIVNAKNVTVSNCIFKNTNGTAPQAGIDIEPDINFSVEGVKIINTTCYGNKGAGIATYGEAGGVRGIEITNCTVKDNAERGLYFHVTSDVLCNNTTVINNDTGVLISGDVNNASFKNMTISKNNRNGFSVVNYGQKVGIEKIVFEDSIISNNSQRGAGLDDGIVIKNCDNSGYMKDITFRNIQVFDDQTSPTQRYGALTVTSDAISGIVFDANCIFYGNILKDRFESPIEI